MTSNNVQSTVEFTVDLNCQKCVDKTSKVLQDSNSVSDFLVDLKKQKVLITSSLPTSELQRILESTGKKAVIVGLGAPLSSSASSNKEKKPEFLAAAVSAIGGSLGFNSVENHRKVQGVVRFVQVDEDVCVIDGTLDGLEPLKPHGIAVYECGDLSAGCGSLGNHFNPRGKRHGSPEDQERHVGDLGNVIADSAGRAEFKISDKLIKVWDIIGRSVGVAEKEDDLGRGNTPDSKINGNCGKVLSCGIIARSSGLFQNEKKFCACDGVSIWEERNKPVSGPDRSSH